MIQSKLRGTGVALVTPFAKDGAIDFNGLEKVIDLNDYPHSWAIPKCLIQSN